MRGVHHHLSPWRFTTRRVEAMIKTMTMSVMGMLAMGIIAFLSTLKGQVVLALGVSYVLSLFEVSTYDLVMMALRDPFIVLDILF